MSIRGTVAYASQEACIFSTTLKDNVLFGLPYDPDWYNTVIEVCALDKVQYIINVSLILHCTGYRDI